MEYAGNVEAGVAIQVEFPQGGRDELEIRCCGRPDRRAPVLGVSEQCRIEARVGDGEAAMGLREGLDRGPAGQSHRGLARDR